MTFTSNQEKDISVLFIQIKNKGMNLKLVLNIYRSQTKTKVTKTKQNVPVFTKKWAVKNWHYRQIINYFICNFFWLVAKSKLKAPSSSIIFVLDLTSTFACAL